MFLNSHDACGRCAVDNAQDAATLEALTRSKGVRGNLRYLRLQRAAYVLHECFVFALWQPIPRERSESFWFPFILTCIPAYASRSSREGCPGVITANAAGSPHRECASSLGRSVCWMCFRSTTTGFSMLSWRKLKPIGSSSPRTSTRLKSACRVWGTFAVRCPGRHMFDSHV